MNNLGAHNFENIWGAFQRLHGGTDDLAPLLSQVSMSAAAIPAPPAAGGVVEKAAAAAQADLAQQQRAAAAALVNEQRLKRRIVADLNLMIHTYLREQAHALASGNMELCLPVVDVSGFLLGPEASTADYLAAPLPDEGDAVAASSAAAALRALEEYGAFQAVGHGVAADLMARAFAAAGDFFALPDTIKNSIPARTGGFSRGYIGIGGESGGTAREVKEGFSYGFPWPDGVPGTNPLEGPNVYPLLSSADGNGEVDGLPEAWRLTLQDLYARMVAAALATARCLAAALRRPDLLRRCAGGDSISLMRIFRYLAAPAGAGAANYDEAAETGSSPHTDWGFLTLIAATQPGLEVFSSDNAGGGAGVWRTVRPVPGALTVNAGDYLALLTGGQVVSPLHRVVRPRAADGGDRTSFVFFFYPGYDSEAVPAGGSEVVADRGVSLLKDQTATGATDGRALDVESLRGVKFGEYILKKWASVARY
ncbi:hypothetical protein HK405_009551 [Cladochytrium tenue]|nr:hypothetical protein HK405_009551 [Cladochytrium tenue]